MRPSVAPADILLLSLLALIWGTSFTILKIALGSFPPVTIAAIRVTIGACLLLGFLRLSGRRMPAGRRIWGFITLTTIIGNVLPFCLIGWGQDRIDSAVAAICMASVPLFTLPLAHFVTHDEKLTARRLIGITIGFGGVLMLFAGKNTNENTAAIGVIAVLTGAFSYSIEGLLIRRYSTRISSTASAPFDGIALTAALMLVAALILIPLSLVIDRPWTLSPAREATYAVLYLGSIGSAVAMAVMVTLISRVGATITSLNNYLVPLIGVLAGILWLGESLSIHAVLACVLILSGVAVTSQWKSVS